MYHPTTRVLTVLELLQSHQRMSGSELAARLEVDTRTARRYITMLQDMGIPIEAERGRYGAYRLRPGFKLPPLMLNSDEALAVTLGLLVARGLGIADAAPVVEGAIAKIERVLPPHLREQIQAVQAALAIEVRPPRSHAQASSLFALSTAVNARRLIELGYCNDRGLSSQRTFAPYGIVYRQSRWYVTGYCHLRQGLRLFRVDRITSISVSDAIFERPSDFDAADYVARSIVSIPAAWQAEVFFPLPPDELSTQLPALIGTIESHPEGSLLRANTDDLATFARDIARVGVALRVHYPHELRQALTDYAAEIMAWATA